MPRLLSQKEKRGKRKRKSNNLQKLKATVEQLSKNCSMEENVNQGKDITTGQAIP